MKLALIQCSATDDQSANVTQGLESLEEAAKAGADLVVYPELAFTPFYPQHRKQCYAECEGNDLPPLSLAEEIPGPTTELFCEAAKRLGVVVVLNLYARKGDAAFDASPVIDADGTLLGVTKMMHITQYEGFYEQDYYTAAGTQAPVYDTAAGRIGAAICYDRHYRHSNSLLPVNFSYISTMNRLALTVMGPSGRVPTRKAGSSSTKR